MTDVEKAVGLLSERGVLDRLKVEAQSERELERAGLLEKLIGIEAEDAARGAELADEVAKATSEIAKHERALNEARLKLNNLIARNAGLGVMAAQIRNRLRDLADPAIDEALINLSLISELARREFRSATVYSRPDPLTGKRSPIDESNSESIDYILHECADVRMQLEALKEAPRPADLPAIIERLLSGLRLKLRTLMGV